MLERLPYFQFKSADYLLDTLNLTRTEQHGAYLLLIVNYYWTGTIPTDRAEIYAMCRADDDRNRAAVDLVLARYFHNESGQLVHHRIERELEKLQRFLQFQSDKGKRSGEVRAAAAPTKAKPRKSRANGETNLPAFDALWSAYPRHQGRAAALKAWAALHPDDALQGRILAAVAIQRSSSDWQRDGGKYVPMLSTYIHGRRWEDEVKPAQEPAFPL